MIKSLGFFILLSLVISCSTLPTVNQEKYHFPKDVYIGDPKRPYQSLGIVRERVTFPTLDMDHEEAALCQNYFNHGADLIVKRAKKVGADAVIDVQSVVFLGDGRREMYPQPECSDDGQEGEVLVQGIAVKWKPMPSPTPSPSP